MIYTYEAEVLKHVNKACPEIRLATYASDISMFGSMAQVTQTPVLLFYRQATEWNFAASFRVNDGTMSGRFVPANQSYIARIYFTQTADAIAMASTLRFYMEDHPYVTKPSNIDYLTSKYIDGEDMNEYGNRQSKRKALREEYRKLEKELS